jgi:hypothetical protein
MPLVEWALGTSPQVLVTHPDVGVTAGAPAALVLAANSNRLTAYIQNVGSNSARIGDSNTGASQGIPVAGGVAGTIEATGPIYAYSASGTTLAIVETVRP